MDEEEYEPNERTRRAAARLGSVVGGSGWNIWSTSRNRWWMPDHRGYTEDREKAGVYSDYDALQIYANNQRGWHPTLAPDGVTVVLVPYDREFAQEA